MIINIFLMLCSTMLYSMHTCLLRYFKNTYLHGISSELLVSYQYLISLIILFPFVHKRAKRIIEIVKTNIIPFALRCVMILTSACIWFYTLSKVPAVSCIAISCMTPVFILFFAKILLNEALTKEIILFAVCAFIGAIIIISPRLEQFNVYSLLAIVTASIWGFNSVFTKKFLSTKINSIDIFFTTAILLSIIVLPYIILHYHNSISLQQLLCLTIITIIFDLANISLIWVFSKGRIVLVAPFDFFRVVFTIIFSYLILNDKLSSNIFIGSTIILISNLLSTFYGKKITNSNTIIKKFKNSHNRNSTHVV